MGGSAFQFAISVIAVPRGSFDAMDGRNAAQILSAFIAGEHIILAHIDIAEKSNEIPAMQTLIAELGLKDKLYTADTMHCQKPSRP